MELFKVESIKDSLKFSTFASHWPQSSSATCVWLTCWTAQGRKNPHQALQEWVTAFPVVPWGLSWRWPPAPISLLLYPQVCCKGSWFLISRVLLPGIRAAPQCRAAPQTGASLLPSFSRSWPYGCLFVLIPSIRCFSPAVRATQSRKVNSNYPDSHYKRVATSIPACVPWLKYCSLT